MISIAPRQFIQTPIAHASRPDMPQNRLNGRSVTKIAFQKDSTARQMVPRSRPTSISAQTEKLKVKDGLYVLRVVAIGTVARKNAKNEPEAAPMQWIYYLAANGDGRQIAFVFCDERRFDLDVSPNQFL